MKIKNGFMVREIAGETVVVPVGSETVDFDCMINLNTTGAFLWKLMETDISETELSEKLAKAYSIHLQQAKADVSHFVNKLKDADLVE